MLAHRCELAGRAHVRTSALTFRAQSRRPYKGFRLSKITFIAFLYLIGISFVAIGALDIYFSFEFSLAGVRGTMSTTDPNVARVAKNLPGSSMVAAVVYTTSSGTVNVPNKRLGPQDVERLARGETIPIVFLKRDPDRTIGDGASPRAPEYGWTIFGALALAVAIFAHRLLRREAGVG